MTEKFKTKYHALAWAAEDENNVFVDGEDFRFKIRNDGMLLVTRNSESIDYFMDNIQMIKEPCHKLEVEKPSLQEQIDELKKQVEELNRPQVILPGVPGYRWIYDPSNPMKVTCEDARKK